MGKETSSKLSKTTPVNGKASSKAFKESPSQEEVALRAYFISERRQKLGWSGDPISDWIQAEQQLLAEVK